MAASAITYSGPIINMLIAVAQGLSVAGMALIGQMNGIGNFKEAKRVSTQVFVFAFTLGCIIAPLLSLVALSCVWEIKPTDISQCIYISSFKFTSFAFFPFLNRFIMRLRMLPENRKLRLLEC